MKKSYIFIIVGVLLLVGGISLYVGTMEKPPVVQDNLLLSMDEAKNLISEKVNHLIKVYENTSQVFDVTVIDENDSKVNKINNYSEVIDTIFTENGKKEFENITFGKKKFVSKDDNGVYFLSSIPLDNSYLNSSIVLTEIDIKEDKISGIVTFTDSVVGDDDALNYYIIYKNITLVKVNDAWLIESFLYSNE